MAVRLQSAIGFASITLPGAAGQFVQLPAIDCDVIGFAKTAGDIRLAGSGTPGNAYLTLNTSASGQAANSSPTIPCAGNASNLWVANDGNTAQTIGFLWLAEAAKPIWQAV